MEWAALIAAIAAVIVAIPAIPRTGARPYWIAAGAGLVVLAICFGLGSQILKPSETGAQDSGRTNRPTQQEHSATPQNTNQPEPVPSDDVQFSGDVILSSNLDFDERPPHVATKPGPAAHDIYVVGFTSGEVAASAFARVAFWKQPSDPTKAQCDDVLARLNVANLGYSFDRFEAGLSFCFGTDEGRTVFVRVKEVTKDGFLLSVTVWNLG